MKTTDGQQTQTDRRNGQTDRRNGQDQASRMARIRPEEWLDLGLKNGQHWASRMARRLRDQALRTARIRVRMARTKLQGWLEVTFKNVQIQASRMASIGPQERLEGLGIRAQEWLGLGFKNSQNQDKDGQNQILGMARIRLQEWPYRVPNNYTCTSEGQDWPKLVKLSQSFSFFWRFF